LTLSRRCPTAPVPGEIGEGLGGREHAQIATLQLGAFRVNSDDY